MGKSSALYSSPDEEGEYDLDFIEGGVEAFLYLDFLFARAVCTEWPACLRPASRSRSGLRRKFFGEMVLDVSLILE